MKIVIKGNSGILLENTRNSEYFENLEEIQNELTVSEFEDEILVPLKTLKVEDNFVEYMDEPLSTKFTSGFTTFEVEKHEGKYYLYSVCTYQCKDKLTEQDFTPEEIKELVIYTQGQWSDGIGEGFEQFPAFDYDNYEAFISCWVRGQQIQVAFKD